MRDGVAADDAAEAPAVVLGDLAALAAAARAAGVSAADTVVDIDDCVHCRPKHNTSSVLW